MDDDELEQTLQLYVEILNREGLGSEAERAAFLRLSAGDERLRRMFVTTRILKAILAPPP